MSNDVVKDSPAARTRSRDSELARKSLEPISERVKHLDTDRMDNLRGKPVKASPGSPSRLRKNQSAKSTSTPKGNQRSPLQQKKGLYPKVEERLYPDLPNYNNEEEDRSDIDESDETDNVSYDDDSSWNEVRKRGPIGSRDKTPVDGRSVSDGKTASKNRKEKKKVASETNGSNNNGGIIVALVIVVLFALLICAMYLNRTSTEEPVEISVDYFKMFKPTLEEIQKKYPSQSPKFWRVMSAALRRLLTEKVETYPAVVLLGIPDGSSETGTCISKDIINSLNSFFNSSSPGYISSSALTSDSPGKLKVDLDEKLIQNLKNGKGVVLDHIEQLPAQVALLLHGYCDGDNAPFKSSAIILGLHVRTRELSDRDNAIEAVLNDLWEKDLGIDEMPALRSRIANSITVVSKEPGVKC